MEKTELEIAFENAETKEIWVEVKVFEDIITPNMLESVQQVWGKDWRLEIGMAIPSFDDPYFQKKPVVKAFVLREETEQEKMMRVIKELRNG